MNKDPKDIKQTNDNSNLHRDEIGENTGTDTQLNKAVKTDDIEAGAIRKFKQGARPGR